MQPTKSRAGTGLAVYPARAALALILLASPVFAQLAANAEGKANAEQKQANLASFETVWTTIRDKHWEMNPGGLDWQAIHAEYRPRIEAAASTEAARGIMREMIGRLKQTHFAIFPAAVYQVLDADGSGDGWPGFDTRVIDGRVIVTEVHQPQFSAFFGANPGVNASKIKPGWEILQVNGTDLAPLVAKLQTDPAIHELQLERAVAARLSGQVGAVRSMVFADQNNARVRLDVKLLPPRGEFSGFGNLPPQPVWFESKKLGNTSYIRFNIFLDLVHVMREFGDAVQQCAHCDGMLIDLRGNPGGIGAMAMGMAGGGEADGRTPGRHVHARRHAQLLHQSARGGFRGSGCRAGGRKLGFHFGNFRRRPERPRPGPHLRHANRRGRTPFRDHAPAQRRRFSICGRELYLPGRKGPGG